MSSERRFPPICKVCQVLDDGATNHTYCKSFLLQETAREEKEKQAETKRKREAMAAILDEHYKDEPQSKKTKSKPKVSQKQSLKHLVIYLTF